MVVVDRPFNFLQMRGPFSPFQPGQQCSTWVCEFEFVKRHWHLSFPYIYLCSLLMNFHFYCYRIHNTARPPPETWGSLSLLYTRLQPKIYMNVHYAVIRSRIIRKLHSIRFVSSSATQNILYTRLQWSATAQNAKNYTLYIE